MSRATILISFLTVFYKQPEQREDALKAVNAIRDRWLNVKNATQGTGLPRSDKKRLSGAAKPSQAEAKGKIIEFAWWLKKDREEGVEI